MDDATLRNQIGSNIAAYRKQAGLTQAGLAEKLNYSDKAVSKWERGESVPDVMTLVQLAELFQIPVGELLADPNALPGNPGTLERAMTQVSEKARFLSGGNQQKVVLAKWLASNPRILVLDEPTRGIDVSAKAEIYALINNLTAQGMAILLVSSELPEIMGISDRIIVMHDGEITGEFQREEFSEQSIMTCAIGRRKE